MNQWETGYYDELHYFDSDGKVLGRVQGSMRNTRCYAFFGGTALGEYMSQKQAKEAVERAAGVSHD